MRHMSRSDLELCSAMERNHGRTSAGGSQPFIRHLKCFKTHRQPMNPVIENICTHYAEANYPDDISPILPGILLWSSYADQL